MPVLKLQLEFASEACRETVGWLIPGHDPQRWLDELSRWPVPHADLRLIVIARSLSERHPRGVLVLGGCPPVDAVSPVCRAYGCVADHFYLPVDGRFVPEVTPGELSRMLHGERDYVWVPHGELIACDAAERLTLADLLRSPPRRDVDWDRADAGEAFAHKLAAVLPEQPPTMETIFRQQRQEIGDSQEQLDQLPPKPDEPRAGPVEAAGRKVRRWLAQLGERLGGGAEASSGAEPDTSHAGRQAASWLNQIPAWLGRKLQGLDPGLQSEREREIDRLLSMLDEDPDRGLHYALPIGGGPDTHRGVAEPSAKLGPRDIDFQLGGRGGGSPADPWFISAELQRRLWKRYRELAEREVQLGRYRRAAYIFAELLHDLPSAAAALRDGGYWREAAALYQQLGQLRQAAECLEQGGLLPEAIELYQKLDDLERVGDLYLRLEDVEAAREAYWKLVQRYQQRSNFVQAARVLEAKLKCPEEALARLQLGWRDSVQATRCFEGVLRLFGELGRHEETRCWLETEIPRHVPDRLEVAVATSLSKAAREYPDELTRRAADYAVRKLVADRFEAVESHERTPLLSAVSSLVPRDRLLSRDCQRFVQSYDARRRAQESRPRTSSAGGLKRLRLVQSFRLTPHRGDWSAAVSAEHGIYAAINQGGWLLVRRIRWDGRDEPSDRLDWRLRPGFENAQVLLVPPAADRHLLVHVIGHPQLEPKRMSPSSACPWEVTCGAVDGMSDGVLAATRGETGEMVLLERRVAGMEMMVLRGRSVPFFLPIDVHPAVSESGQASLPLHFRRTVALFGSRNELVAVPPGYRQALDPRESLSEPYSPATLNLPGVISTIIGARGGTRPCVAVALDIGGRIYFDVRGIPFLADHHWPESAQPFASDMLTPVIGMNHAGLLMAINEERYEVYTTRYRRLRLMAGGALHAAKPIAVLPPPNTGQFAVVTTTGEIRILELR